MRESFRRRITQTNEARTRDIDLSLAFLFKLITRVSLKHSVDFSFKQILDKLINVKKITQIARKRLVSRSHN